MDNAPLPGQAAGAGMSKSRLKASLHLLGSALACLGVLFVGVRLYKYTGQVNLARFDAWDWGLTAGLACVYGAANVFLACAWQHLLAFFHVEVERKWAVKVYGLSQLAKYVPGNIFHLAGRQALGMAAGVPALALGKSTVWELALLAVTGLLFGVLALPLVWPSLPVSVAAFGVSTDVGEHHQRGAAAHGLCPGRDDRPWLSRDGGDIAQRDGTMACRCD